MVHRQDQGLIGSEASAARAPDDIDEQFRSLIHEARFLEMEADLAFAADAGGDSILTPGDIAEVVDQLLHAIASHGPSDLSNAEVWAGAMCMLATLVTKGGRSHLADAQDARGVRRH